MIKGEDVGKGNMGKWLAEDTRCFIMEELFDFVETNLLLLPPLLYGRVFDVHRNRIYAIILSEGKIISRIQMHS